MYESIREVGLVAARKIAGEQAVQDAAVKLVADWTGRPSYRFTFLIDHASSHVRPGLLRIRVTQALTDEFATRNDEHGLEIETLGRIDWDKRAIA